MRRAVLSSAVVVLAFLVPAVLAQPQAPSPKKRLVNLSIAMSAAPDAKGPQAMTYEGEMATVGIKDVGLFGFTPMAKQGDDKIVVVTIFDAAAKPAAELGKIEVPLGGDAVASKTKPPFYVKVLSVK